MKNAVLREGCGILGIQCLGIRQQYEAHEASNSIGARLYIQTQ